MPSNKQRRSNRIEYWPRLGPLSSRDIRKIYPGQAYIRKCICGLSFEKSNYLLRTHVVLGFLLVCLIALVSLLTLSWQPIAIIAGVWLLMAISFIALGHKPACAFRRPAVIIAEFMGPHIA